VSRLGVLLLVGATAVGLAVCKAPEEPAVVVCNVRFAAPAGFEPLEPFEERYPDHVGVRLGFRDDRRREFHVFAGIPGEFGEGLPSAGSVGLTGGRSGSLAGRVHVWVLTWEEGGPCDPRAVIGNGFSRDEFHAALVDAGLAPQE
jgi:hypothetical protein